MDFEKADYGGHEVSCAFAGLSLATRHDCGYLLR